MTDHLFRIVTYSLQHSSEMDYQKKRNLGNFYPSVVECDLAVYCKKRAEFSMIGEVIAFMTF